jgi:hypothetical protein
MFRVGYPPLSDARIDRMHQLIRQTDMQDGHHRWVPCIIAGESQFEGDNLAFLRRLRFTAVHPQIGQTRSIYIARSEHYRGRHLRGVLVRADNPNVRVAEMENVSEIQFDPEAVLAVMADGRTRFVMRRWLPECQQWRQYSASVVNGYEHAQHTSYMHMI